MKQIIIKKQGTKFICQCFNCHKHFEIAGFVFRGGQGKFCSHHCFAQFLKGKPRKWRPNIEQRRKISEISKRRLGKLAANWRGGRRIESGSGYILIYSPEHPFPNSDKYVYEHRLIMEKYLGRFLKRTEHIHHINGKPADNRIENLKLCSRGASDHIRQHIHRHNPKNGRFIS